MQLLPRLASYRDRWQNDRLEGALAEAIEHLRTVWMIRVFRRTCLRCLSHSPVPWGGYAAQHGSKGGTQ